MTKDNDLVERRAIGVKMSEGKLVQSIDNIFLVLVCLLFAVVSLGYLVMRFWQIMSSNGDQKAK
jgi:hypothetical protein